MVIFFLNYLLNNDYLMLHIELQNAYYAALNF